MEPGILGLGSVTSAAFLLFIHLLQIGVFLVVLRYLDIYEREPFGIILGMFVWGALGATLLSLIGNGIVDSMLSPEVSVVYGAAISAPLVEEMSKGLALLVGFFIAKLVARRFHSIEFGGVTDGIIFGAAAGFGFAFVENILYFVQFAAQSGFNEGLEIFFLRADFSGFGGTAFLHAVCTGLTGAGLGMAVWSRNVVGKLGWPLLGLASAMALHANWNGLVSFLLVRRYGFDVIVDAFAGRPLEESLVTQIIASADSALRISRGIFFLVFIGLAVAFVMWLRYERKIIVYELAEEANNGLLTREEYELLPRFWQRTRWYAQLLMGSRATQLRGVRDLHDRLVELALLKWRLRRTGGAAAPVMQMRAEIEALRAYVLRLAAIADQPPALAPPAAAGSTPVGQTVR